MATMVRIAAAVLLTLAVGGMLSANDARAQQSVCLNLAPGTHDLEAPSQEREGNVVFRVVIGEGGEIVEFYEPGGVEIGAAAGIGIFMSGEYQLPEGVAIAACPYTGDDSMSDDASVSEDNGDSLESEASADGEEQAGPPAEAGAAQAGPALCVNLSPGMHILDVTAFGIAMSVTAQIPLCFALAQSQREKEGGGMGPMPRSVPYTFTGSSLHDRKAIKTHLEGHHGVPCWSIIVSDPL